ncbi:transposase [Xanthobacter sp. VTT E-85238]
MSQYDLTDFEWRAIEPLLPNTPRGVPRVDDRQVLNGIFRVLRSGAPRRDLPKCYGPRNVPHKRHMPPPPFRGRVGVGGMVPQTPPRPDKRRDTPLPSLPRKGGGQALRVRRLECGECPIRGPINLRSAGRCGRRRAGPCR